MRSFELRESPLRADHMTTKPLPSPREHTCTLRRFHSKNHTGTHVYFGQTRKRISAAMHQFGFAAALLLRRIQRNPSTLALQACRLNICSRGQQEHPPERVAQLANRNAGGGHKAGCSGRLSWMRLTGGKEGCFIYLFTYFCGGRQQLHVFFHRSTGFKVFRLSKMTHLLFEGLLHHHNWRDPRSFLQGLSFGSNPSSCQNTQRYNFRFPSQLSDSSQACHGASNRRELVLMEGNAAESRRRRWTQMTVI